MHSIIQIQRRLSALAPASLAATAFAALALISFAPTAALAGVSGNTVAGTQTLSNVPAGANITFGTQISAQQMGNSAAPWPSGEIDITLNGAYYATLNPGLNMSGMGVTLGSSGASIGVTGSGVGSGWQGSPGGYTQGQGWYNFAINNAPAGAYVFTYWWNTNQSGVQSTRFMINTPTGVNVPAATFSILPPTASITASPSTVTYPGSSTISWSSSGTPPLTTSVSGPGLSSSANPGSQAVSGLSVGTNTYTITASNGGGNVTQTATVTVSAGSQSVSISPGSQTINAGGTASFNASGGNNGYVWGGSASGSGATQNIVFNSPGTYTVTTYSPGGGNYTQSNTASASVTVNTVGQTVSIFPPSQSIIAGGSVTFTASGGNNGYNWGGSASGSGTSQSVTFPNAGTYTVSVSSPAGGIYSASNTATATITVTAASQTIALTPAAPSITAGSSVTFTATGGQNGYSWGGSASGSGSSQSVAYPNVGTYTVSVVSPAGGNYLASNTATATITVTTVGQTVSISPPTANITAGQSFTFTASGGNTSYTWGGSASGSGTSQSVTFPTAGNYTVTVYAPASGTWAQSNTATATVTVTAQQPQNVMISPPMANITAGQSVTFTATGGNTTYTWGGSASGSGTSKGVTFPTAGNYTVTVFAPAGGTWAQSPTATANVIVMPQQPQNVVISPPAANITAGQAVTFTASGGNTSYIWGGSASGSGTSQSVTFPTAGNYTVTVYAPAGGTWAQSNIVTATVTVMPLQPQNLVISPPMANITAGQSVTFNANGGHNGYVWGGSASGSGPSQSITFPNVGNYSVTASSPAGGLYQASNIATANIIVGPAPQTVTISPVAPSITAGNSVSFTASGGLTPYVWGGSAAGSGSSQSASFFNIGLYTVSVYSLPGGNFAQSNTAVSTVTVTAIPQTIAISPITTTTFAGVPVPFTASGSHTGYTWGGSAAGSGSAQSVTFASQGTYTVTVAAPANGNYAASNTAIATITVKAAPPKITSTNDKNTVEVQDQDTKGPNAIQAPAH